jgi:exo-beta-1,3-glucanase (GH17 family)
MYEDLLALKKANFTGLVTYSSFGVMGQEFPTIAESLGFDGIIMGVWDPANARELRNAKNASSLPMVLGYTIGNEGFDRRRDRYTISELCSTITDLRLATGKPVTTSEEVDDYYLRPQLLSVGDWLFPNAHPYWHFTKYPAAAVSWEQEQFHRFRSTTDRFILFREVGLPTDGAFGLSETNHDQYYRELAKTDVRFVYFEGFDQPSKTHATVEPHWGIFRSTRRPKLLAWNLMGYRLFTSTGKYDGWIRECSETSVSGCELHSAAPILRVGDDAKRRQSRAFLSFNTAGLPDNAVITSTKLKIKSAGFVGADLFNKGQGLIVEACKPFFGASVKLHVTDFETGTGCQKIGIFEKNTGNGWYVAAVDASLSEYIHLGGLTQFRLRFTRYDDNDRGADYFTFYSGLADEANRPVLLVRYSTP